MEEYDDTSDFKSAKNQARTKPQEGKDWRDYWKYGRIVRSVGLKRGNVEIEFGQGATEEQKRLLALCITSPTKWAKTVEELLDNPPSDEEIKILKVMRKYGTVS